MEISKIISLRVYYPCCGWRTISIRMNGEARLSLECPACKRLYSIFYLEIPNKELLTLLKIRTKSRIESKPRNSVKSG